MLRLVVILTEFRHCPAATDEAFDSEEGLNANRHQEGGDGVALEGNPHKETPLIEGNAKMKTEQNEKELTGNVAHVVDVLNQLLLLTADADAVALGHGLAVLAAVGGVGGHQRLLDQRREHQVAALAAAEGEEHQEDEGAEEEAGEGDGAVVALHQGGAEAGEEDQRRPAEGHLQVQLTAAAELLAEAVAGGVLRVLVVLVLVHVVGSAADASAAADVARNGQIDRAVAPSFIVVSRS
ncbi:hypothetical protein TYRP_016312 [Tyrophagus putrescentiae]|nr:hypothetical protein TYRP_016312 [Tyrophagus putrescentiae]